MASTSLLVVFALFVIVPPWIGPKICTCDTSTAEEDESKYRMSDETNPHHVQFQTEVNANEIEKELRYLYSQVHLTGPTRGLESAEYLAKKWREYGFDEVEIPEYHIVTSHPQPSKPNMITIENNGNIEYTIEGKIKLFPDPTKTDTVDFYPFVGYSPNKTVEGDLVYVNFGESKDYRLLKERHINVNGKIVLARGRPNVYLASSEGAIGLISFPNPEMYAAEGTSDDKTYPHAKWLSKDAVQMWAAYGGINYYGDVASPGTPSNIGRDGIPMEKLRKVLPNIPAQPISYGQAKELLQRIKGEEVPESWEIPGFHMTLRMGPGFQTPGSKVKLQVNTQLAKTPIYNVIGTIRGKKEEDKTVIVGSQRDSWAFGAVGALSGTATINEIARVLGRLLKSGWRPRRTIKICSWGGENWRLAGSTEWAEEKLSEDRVNSNVVGYINLDMVASGRFALRARGSPLFKDITTTWAKKITDPINPSKSIYDTWLEKNPSYPNLPNGLVLRTFSASNYKVFYDYLGIPSADFAYWEGGKVYKYPVYHTTEDTLYWMQKFVDPDFKIHKAMTQFSGGMILDLVDSPLIPYRLQDLTDVISKSVSVLRNSQPENKEFGLNKDDLNKLRENATLLHKCAEKIDKEKMKFRSVQINDIMRNAEKPFLVEAGLFFRPYDRHVAFNFGFTNFKSYRNAFPAVAKAILRANHGGSKSEVKKQLTQLADRVYSAIWKWKCYTF